MTDGRLTIIQSTHMSLEGLEGAGLFERHRQLLRRYAESFAEVVVYSSDARDYSSALGVRHVPVPWLPRGFGWRHLVFYAWLIACAPRMRGVVKVFGSNIPTLPLVRLLSRRPMMVTYQWHYVDQTLQNERRGLKSWLPPLLERLAVAPADLVLVTAEWLEAYIRRAYRKPTVLLPNWVDLRSIPPSAPADEREAASVLFVGRLHWSKGVDVLIRAIAAVRQTVPSARLVVCGAGEERPRLEALAAEIAPGCVDMRGVVPNRDVLALMRSCAVYVLPTVTMEGHPKALVEAMACGAPCIATGVPGNREVIRDGVDGRLVPPRDVEALADAILALLSSPEERARLGATAAEVARELDFEVVVQREIETLRRLAALPGP